MRHAVLAMALVAGPALAQESGLDVDYWAGQGPAVARIIGDMQRACAELDGDLAVEGEPFTELDLDLDGQWDDLVIDQGRIFCTRAMTLWAGTGGSPIHFVVDGTHHVSVFGRGWDIVRMGPYHPTVILVSRHGSVCGGAGVTPCVQALVYDGEAFRTPVEATLDE